MESTFVKIAQVLLGQPPDTLRSSEELVVTSFIKGVDSFSKISKIILGSKQKPLTPAKIEDVGRELSNVIFRVGCLVHLLGLDPANFDAENLTEFSQDFDPTYQNDTILCSMMGVGSFAELVDVIYLDEETLEEGAGEEVEVESPVVQSVSGSDEDPDDDEATSPKEYLLASILASCILLCELLDIDFGNICYNSTLATKF